MFNLDDLKRLPDSIKCNMINYCEGLPKNIVSYVKMNMNNNHISPYPVLGSNNVLHTFSTLRNYVKGARITDKIDDDITYQKEYCNCIDLIDSKKVLSGEIRHSLIAMLNSYSYDEKTMSMIEVQMAELLESMMKLNIITTDIAQLINNHIIDYKLRSYDLYRYISLYGTVDSDLISPCSMANTNTLILGRLHNIQLSDQYDIPIFIYIYYNELGISDKIYEYHLFDRFKCHMIANHVDMEIIDNMYSRLIELSSGRPTVSKALELLTNPDKYSSIISCIHKVRKSSFNNNKNIQSCDDMIYFFKNKDVIEDNMNELSLKIKQINIPEILNYMDGDKEYAITFDINANDYGHLKNMDGMNVGTVYSGLSNEMKYIGYFDNVYYVLFKHKMRPSKIYGISVNKTNNCRSILTIDENTSYHYEVSFKI